MTCLFRGGLVGFVQWKVPSVWVWAVITVVASTFDSCFCASPLLNGLFRDFGMNADEWKMFFWHRLFLSPYKQAMTECDWENCSILLFMDVTVTRTESRQLGQNISKSPKLQLTSDPRDQDSKFRVHVRNLGDLCIVYHHDFSCPTWPGGRHFCAFVLHSCDYGSTYLVSSSSLTAWDVSRSCVWRSSASLIRWYETLWGDRVLELDDLGFVHKVLEIISGSLSFVSWDHCWGERLNHTNNAKNFGLLCKCVNPGPNNSEPDLWTFDWLTCFQTPKSSWHVWSLVILLGFIVAYEV
jgi:hypothetical protein